MFDIQSNIPMDKPYRKYPWKLMKVGDSFFVPNKTSRRMATLANHISKRNRLRFHCQMRIEDGISGCRVWRTE